MCFELTAAALYPLAWDLRGGVTVKRNMSTAWKMRPNPQPDTNLCLEVGWLESSCPCVAKAYAPRTAALRAGFFFFFSIVLLVSEGGKTATAPATPPPTHPPETVLKRSGYEEEKVGGVNGRNLWPTRGHRAVFDPQEATDEQPNTRGFKSNTRGRAARSDVDTGAPGGRLDFHSMRPDRKSRQKQISASSGPPERRQMVHFIPSV